MSVRVSHQPYVLETMAAAAQVSRAVGRSVLAVGKGGRSTEERRRPLHRSGGVGGGPKARPSANVRAPVDDIAEIQDVAHISPSPPPLRPNGFRFGCVFS